MHDLRSFKSIKQILTHSSLSVWDHSVGSVPLSSAAHKA
jgi:hypothetical protein